MTSTRSGLVDRYVLYLAPAFFGGDDARPMFDGRGAGTVDDLWQGRLVSVAASGSTTCRVEAGGLMSSLRGGA